MSLYLKKSELKAIQERECGTPLDDLYWLYINKAKERQSQTGLFNHNSTQDWWHLAFEYISESCLAYRFKENDALGSWIRSTTLSLVRRPVDDWIGPWYRNHSAKKACGHLETAHLSWSVSVAYDLCGELFSDNERKEIEDCLLEKGIGLCETFCAMLPRGINNWYCILLAGIIVPASVLGKKDILEKNLERVKYCIGLFQEDGSYGESAQYGNYALQGLFLVVESYHRAAPGLLDLNLTKSYAQAPRFWAYNYIHRKPLTGWGSVPRSFNFGDSAAIFAPSGDILLHMASTLKEVDPDSASLAKWLFEQVYLPVEQPVSDDRKSFGFFPGMGFLTPVLLTHSTEAVGRENLEKSKTFDNGYTFLRDQWEGQTALAVAGASKPLNAVSHLHGDINSLILVFRGERLLADPGHSCYRGLVHQQEISSLHHNTCTFILPGGNNQDLIGQNRNVLAQNGPDGVRYLSEIGLGDSIPRGKKLGTFDNGQICHTGHDAGQLYDDPMEIFERHIILCGSQVIFIIDHIKATKPVIPVWSWVLNNRDNRLEMNLLPPDRIVARRGQVGMKMFHGEDSSFSGPHYGYIHDAYHPLPGQKGEGKQGSAHIFRWTGRSALKEQTAIHAMALGGYGEIASWHYHKKDQTYGIERPGESWSLETDSRGFTLKRVDRSQGEKPFIRKVQFGEEF